MSEIKTQVLQQFREALPNFNWKLGSVIRELLVEPLAYLDTIIGNYATYLKNLSRLDYVLDNPELCAVELSSWVKFLGLESPESSPSTGTVTLELDSDADITIPRGAIFIWGDTVNLFVEQDQKFSTALGNISKIYNGCYRISVKVVTTSDVTVSLSAGAPVVWSEAPESVLSMYVDSPITGGTGELSYTALAELVKSKLTSPAMCGTDNIRAGLLRRFPGTVADVQLAARMAGTAAGEVPLAIKQLAPPAKDSLSAVVYAGRVDEGTREVTVSRRGLLDILRVYTAQGQELEFERTDPNNSELVVLSVKSKASAEPVKVGTKVIVECVRQSDSVSCYSWLSAQQTGAPFKFVYTDIALVDLHLDIAVSSSRSVSEFELAEIQSCINSGRINQTITDSEISAILSRHQKQLKRNIVYSGDVRYRGTKRSFCSSGGGLHLQGLCGFHDIPVAAYTSVDKIRMAHNG